MAAKSPNYPAIDLGTALMAVANVFAKETRNKMSRSVLAKHLGYNSLNGRALGKIAAVRSYGLIEGSGDELRISDDAVDALKAPVDSDARKAALERLATRPSLFKDLRADFPDTLPSEANIEYWLAKRGFTGKGAGKAAKSYLATMNLVSGDSGAYNPVDDDEDPEMQTQVTEPKRNFAVAPSTPTQPRAGMLQEVFNLEEGPVTLTFPSTLSGESYQDLADHLELFLRKAKRRAETMREYREMIGDTE